MKKYIEEDITGRIGATYSDAEVTMYSFERVAWMFWQGFYNSLRTRGLTEKQAFEEMQSKGPRRMLDNNEEIKDLGTKLGLSYSLCVTENKV